VTGWLLDTNVLSELRKPKPSTKVVAFVSAQPIEALFVSSVTIAEIRFGIEILVDASQRGALQDWLTHVVRPMFERQILPVSEDVIFKWRMIVADGRKAGHTFSHPDVIIAATALCHGLTVVSRDAKDFRLVTARIHNPWTASF
jgi:predicted nucleic acid-binding protein